MYKINNTENFCCIKCKNSIAFYKNVLYYNIIIIYSGDLGIF